MAGCCTDTPERMVIESFDNGLNTMTWSHWRRNYISAQRALFREELSKEFAEYWSKTLFYIREVDSIVIQGPFKLRSARRVERISYPDDTRFVWFECVDPPNVGIDQYRLDGEILSFYHSPSYGSLLPPLEVIDAPLTAEIVRAWPKWFIAGPGHEKAAQTRCAHDYFLTSSCPGCDYAFDGTPDPAKD